MVRAAGGPEGHGCPPLALLELERGEGESLWFFLSGKVQCLRELIPGRLHRWKSQLLHLPV